MHAVQKDKCLDITTLKNRRGKRERERKKDRKDKELPANSVAKESQ